MKGSGEDEISSSAFLLRVFAHRQVGTGAGMETSQVPRATLGLLPCCPALLLGMLGGGGGVFAFRSPEYCKCEGKGMGFPRGERLVLRTVLS